MDVGAGLEVEAFYRDRRLNGLGDGVNCWCWGRVRHFHLGGSGGVRLLQGGFVVGWRWVVNSKRWGGPLGR